MKQSDSTTSLSGLTENDKHCYFCHEEAGHSEEMVSASKFLMCTCKFSTHPSCWNTWIFEQKEHKCPICSKIVGRVYVVAEAETRISPLPYICKNWKSALILVVAIGTIFVAGFVVGMILRK